MSFQEKSAWIMLLSLLVAGVIYILWVREASLDFSGLAPPLLPPIIGFTIVCVLIAVLGHIVVSVLAPKEANAAEDERQRRINDRAGHLSGTFLGVGIVMSLGFFFLTQSSSLMFYMAFASLFLSHIVEYGLQIFYLRRSL